jgi:predicted RNA binding protein YcfA (HicA-like mRNA interferase family)
VKYSELFRIIKQNGWIEIRQTGSHVIFRHSERETQLTVPNHGNKEVKTGLLKAILKQADIKTNKR